MPADYYSDASAEQPVAEPAPDPADNQEESDARSTLVPKALFGGKAVKVGDKITLVAKRILEDEVQVEPADNADEGENEPMAKGMSELDAMAK